MSYKNTNKKKKNLTKHEQKEKKRELMTCFFFQKTY